MKLTAEMSLYPLTNEFKPIIQQFIEKLLESEDIEVLRNPLSTQISGSYDKVFQLVSDTLAASTKQFGKQVLVVKFIVGEFD
ncbi:MAG: YkoF family thiamine/hydroxymethylpyrimidine-binding protein, partial [Pseudomonadota bacterium]